MNDYLRMTLKMGWWSPLQRSLSTVNKIFLKESSEPCIVISHTESKSKNNHKIRRKCFLYFFLTFILYRKKVTWIKKVIISLDEGNWFLTTTDILPYSWGMIIIKSTDRQSKKGQIWPFGGSSLTQGLEMGKNKRSINKGKQIRETWDRSLLLY